MLLDLPDFTIFTKDMFTFFSEISLSPKDITDRKELILFVRNKLADRNYQGGEPSGFYTGIDLEIFGSYAAGLSTKDSDLDFRVNDFYTYRYLNLEKISHNLVFDPKTSETWAISKNSRLEILDHLKHARVPIVKMRDRLTGIEFDLS